MFDVDEEASSVLSNFATFPPIISATSILDLEDSSTYSSATELDFHLPNLFSWTIDAPESAKIVAEDLLIACPVKEPSRPQKSATIFGYFATVFIPIGSDGFPEFNIFLKKRPVFTSKQFIYLEIQWHGQIVFSGRELMRTFNAYFIFTLVIFYVFKIQCNYFRDSHPSIYTNNYSNFYD